MNITAIYGNSVTKKDIFSACKNSDYLKNVEGKTISVRQVIFVENDEKNDVMILFCGDDLHPYGTISKACIETVRDYIGFMGDDLELPFAVKIEKATSRAGREYLKLSIV